MKTLRAFFQYDPWRRERFESAFIVGYGIIVAVIVVAYFVLLAKDLLS